MPYCVQNKNISNKPAPTNLTELVNFVEFVRNHRDPIFVQISGYGVEVVKELANHFQVNFFDPEEQKNLGINPFTILYITQENEIKPICINEKSKIVIYANRANHHHH